MQDARVPIIIEETNLVCNSRLRPALKTTGCETSGPTKTVKEKRIGRSLQMPGVGREPRLLGQQQQALPNGLPRHHTRLPIYQAFLNCTKGHIEEEYPGYYTARPTKKIDKVPSAVQA